jgi:hypothetical protein
VIAREGNLMAEYGMTEFVNAITARVDALEAKVAALEANKAQIEVPAAGAEPRPTRSTVTGRYEIKPSE